MRTILPANIHPGWESLNTTFARIHAEVRREIERKHDKDRIAVHMHNLGFMLWLYLKIAIGFWVAGMLYVALT